MLVVRGIPERRVATASSRATAGQGPETRQKSVLTPYAVMAMRKGSVGSPGRTQNEACTEGAIACARQGPSWIRLESPSSDRFFPDPPSPLFWSGPG